ncbi:Os12g0551900 [Oryza sativa Japonica Group]|uniref:Os12g0551900 protein n=1 Tax=Oryza sativa subsp. japonica TaxID=39947 RepID=C7J9S0_ORYSJ|nr:Os12g0551900 [Oryza sativa Japonica Group]|eukprot:NP_001177002.1 Os12g0551900 [Oryza sativa Japonica Group]
MPVLIRSGTFDHYKVPAQVYNRNLWERTDTYALYIYVAASGSTAVRQPAPPPSPSSAWIYTARPATAVPSLVATLVARRRLRQRQRRRLSSSPGAPRTKASGRLSLLHRGSRPVALLRHCGLQRKMSREQDNNWPANSGESDGGNVSPSDNPDNMEDVNPSATTHSGDTATSSIRRGRGPTKMPIGLYTITALDADGNPTAPESALTPYSNAIGVIVKDDIPIKYRHWKTRDPDELEWMVPDRDKELAWERLKRTFQFPEEEIRQLKERMDLIMARLERQDVGDVGRVISPGGRKSNSASIEVTQELGMARYPVDDIHVHSDDEPSDGGSSSEGLVVSPRRMPTPLLPRKSPSPPPAHCKSPSPPSSKHQSLASSIPLKKRGRLCKTSQMSEPPSLKKPKKVPLPNMLVPSLKEKKEMSGSITLLLKHKGDKIKEATNVKVPVAVHDHFNRMARPLAPKPPISDFRRTTRKKRLKEFSKKEFEKDEANKNVQEFLEGAGLQSLSDVDNIAKSPLAAQFKLGYSLTTDEYRKVIGNCTQMRRVEEWYLQMAKEGKVMFPVFYRDEDFHHCDGIVWVPFKELFQLYNLKEVDLSLIQLWVLMGALECRTTHNKLGFLDPQIVNSTKIEGGEKSEKEVLDYLYTSFVKLQDMNTILLPYHFKPHWILLAIHLNDSKIVVMDGMRTPQAKFQSLVDTLDKALVKYKKRIQHAPCSNTFRVWCHPYCSRQDPGTSTCGFYVMKFMRVFMEDGNWNITDSEKLKLPTSKLLPHVCFSLAKQLCGFIVTHIISSNGAYNISRAPAGLMGLIEAGGPNTMGLLLKHLTADMGLRQLPDGRAPPWRLYQSSPEGPVLVSLEI